jgi:hypothetical protein
MFQFVGVPEIVEAGTRGRVADMYGSLFDDSDKDTKTPILFFQ